MIPSEARDAVRTMLDTFDLRELADLAIVFATNTHALAFPAAHDRAVIILLDASLVETVNNYWFDIFGHVESYDALAKVEDGMADPRGGAKPIGQFDPSFEEHLKWIDAKYACIYR